MNVREKIAEITRGVKTQVELDAVVTRGGGLPALFATQFPGVARDEFAYEWEARKLALGGMTSEDD